MFRTCRRLIGAVLGTACLLGLEPTRVYAATLPEHDERRCADAIASGLRRVTRSAGRRVKICLGSGPLDGCVAADARHGIAAASARAAAEMGRHCAEARPDRGSADPPMVHVAGAKGAISVVRDAIGADADAILPSDDDAGRNAAACRRGVLDAAARCVDARLGAVARCVARSSPAPLTAAAMLATCADAATTPSASPGVVAACRPADGRLRRRLRTACEAKHVDLAGVLAGCASGDPEVVARCLDRAAACRACLAVNQAGFLDRDCDALDDGVKNRSCLGLDRWGGWTGVERAATGRFRVEQVEEGTWWFVTPDGHGFFSAGVNYVTPAGDFSPPLGTAPYHDNILAIHGSEAAWLDATFARLGTWNFNTIGGWGPSALYAGRRPYARVLAFNTAAPAVPGGPAGQTGLRIRDYFAPEWPPAAMARAESARPCAGDPFCIGVFSDNELPWGPGPFMVGTHVDAYMALPPGAPGKLGLQQLFEERYGGDLAAFNAAWKQQLESFADLQQLDTLGSDFVCESAAQTADRRAFLRRVAERYYSAVHDALRALDPALLILGSRFPSSATGPDSVAAAGPWVDVVSINDYEVDAGALNLFRQTGGGLFGNFFLEDPFSDLDEIHRLTGKPVMIGEYSYRTPTPGAAVLFPPFFATLPTDAERADAYERYQQEMLSRPYLVGTHWHQYFDQPATGRPDGENSRFGVVTIADEPYPALTARMTAMNARVPERPIPLLRAQALEGLSVALGERVFGIAAPGSDRTGFYAYILPGSNLSSEVGEGPLVLAAGTRDASGNAPLALAADTVVGVRTVIGDIVCLRFHAAGSSGVLSCDGGAGHDATVARAAGEAPSPVVVEAFLGADAGPGAATLLVPTEVARLPAAATLGDCLTTSSYEPPEVLPLTTGMVTVTKGATQLVFRGESFVCGDDGAHWQLEDGPGMLALGFPVFDSRVPGGDLASGFLFADRADVCH